VASYLGNDLCQPGVTKNQPAPRGDTIGLILEFIRLQLVEVLEAAGWCWAKVTTDPYKALLPWVLL
jgi:hypothetical protein